MTRDRHVTRAVAITVLVLLGLGAAVAAAIAAAFLWGSVFNVAANVPHWPVTRWAIERSLGTWLP